MGRSLGAFVVVVVASRGRKGAAMDLALRTALETDFVGHGCDTTGGTTNHSVDGSNDATSLSRVVPIAIETSVLELRSANVGGFD